MPLVVGVPLLLDVRLCDGVRELSGERVPLPLLLIDWVALPLGDGICEYDAVALCEGVNVLVPLDN